MIIIESANTFSKEFSSPSPLNHRKDVADVILLFTDGRPNPHKNTDEDNQIPVAKDYSKKLKEKKVQIFGLAAGKKSFLKGAADLIKKMSSQPSTKYFIKSNIEHVDSLLVDNLVDKIVGPSCNPAAGKWISNT